MTLLRNLLAIVLGAATIGLVVFGIETLGRHLFPTTAPMDPSSLEVMRAFVAAQSIGALVFVVLAWTLGAFAGSVVTIGLARSRHALLAWFIGGLALAMVGVNVWHIPHPAWMVVAGVILPLVAVGIAVRWLAPSVVPAGLLHTR